jgi:rSAM/selenodomain-associated transferase 1
VSDVHLIVIAKSPVAGRVKTRLCPPYSFEQAARIAEASLADTLEVVANTPASARTVVLDGAPDGWLPAGFTVRPQRGGGLDERLAAAFVDSERVKNGPMLLIGMDTPQVTPQLLTAVGRQLTSEGVDAVLGPSTDGGWWTLGLHTASPDLLVGVPMSTSTTYAQQQSRLHLHGLTVAEAPTLTDVDDVESARLVGRAVPSSRFAESLEGAVFAS